MRVFSFTHEPAASAGRVLSPAGGRIFKTSHMSMRQPVAPLTKSRPWPGAANVRGRHLFAFRQRSQTVLGIKPGECLRGDSVTVNATSRGRAGTDPQKGDQPRFERGREGIGPAACESAAGRGENVALALATLPPHEHCPSRRHRGEEGFQRDRRVKRSRRATGPPSGRPSASCRSSSLISSVTLRSAHCHSSIQFPLRRFGAGSIATRDVHAADPPVQGGAARLAQPQA